MMKIFHGGGVFGIRIGRWYIKFKDIRRAPLLYSERQGQWWMRSFGKNWRLAIRGDLPWQP